MNSDIIITMMTAISNPLGAIDVKDLQADIAAGEVITVSYRYGQLGKKLKDFKEDFYVYYSKLK